MECVGPAGREFFRKDRVLGLCLNHRFCIYGVRTCFFGGSGKRVPTRTAGAPVASAAAMARPELISCDGIILFLNLHAIRLGL